MKKEFINYHLKKKKGDGSSDSENEKATDMTSNLMALSNMKQSEREFKTSNKKLSIFDAKLYSDMNSNQNSNNPKKFQIDLEKEKEMGEFLEDSVDEEIDALRYDKTATKSYLIFGDHKGFIKILDVRGIIKKNEFEKATSAMIKSSYNVLKKDDINVEAILSHYLQKEKRPFGNFVNLYHHILVREFQAHEDAITSIAKIDEPFSFVTCSKDKRFKIWNFQCELLGEVNTQPSLHHLNQTPAEWKFKIDWEKLKEQEIEDVIDIFENVGGESTKYDHNIHGGEDYEEPVDEKDQTLTGKEENVVKIAKNENLGRKKRYKPLEIQASKRNDDDNDEAENKYEDQHAQEIKKKIDAHIYPNVPEVGLYEMTKNIFDTAMIRKTPTEMCYRKNINDKKDDREGAKVMFLGDKGSVDFRERDNYKLDYKFDPMQILQKNKYVVPKPVSKTKKTVNSRENLFSEKYFKSGRGNNGEKKQTTKDALLLPLIHTEIKKNENVKFKKGETERIMAFEYYQNSYNACCEIKSSKDISNNSLKKNYNLMWKYVQNYSKNLHDEE